MLVAVVAEGLAPMVAVAVGPMVPPALLGVLIGLLLWMELFWWNKSREKPAPARMSNKASPANKTALPVKERAGLLFTVSCRLAASEGTDMGPSEESCMRCVV